MNNEEISQKTIRELLTGRLDEAAADKLDELSITDAAFADRIAAEQYELIDDWIADRLEREEKAAFETVLARSPTLKEKVEMSRTLAAAVPRAVVVERSAEPSFFARLFGGMPRLAYGFAGLLAVIGVAGLAAFLMRQDSGEIAQVDPPVTVASPSPTPIEQTPTPSTNPTIEPANTATPAPTNTETPRPSPTPTRRTPGQFVAIVLAPPTRGSTGIRSVKIDEETEFLNLTLQTEAPAGRFSVEIGDASGSADWRSPIVRGRSSNGRTSVSVRVPVTRLKTGVRSVRLLNPENSSETIDEHLIRIDR